MQQLTSKGEFYIITTKNTPYKEQTRDEPGDSAATCTGKVPKLAANAE